MARRTALRRAGAAAVVAVVGVACFASYRLRQGRASTQELLAQSLQEPANPAPQARLGERYLEENRAAEAADAFAAAAAAAPDNAEYVARQAKALILAGRAREASALIEGRRARWPNDSMLLCALGDAQFAAGSVLQAAEAYRSALSRKPDMAEAWAGLSLALTDSHDLNGAAEAARRALALAPGSPRANLANGHALDAGGRSAEALSYLQRAVDTEPENPLAREMLASAAVRSARTDEEYARAAHIVTDGERAAPASSRLPYFMGQLLSQRRDYPGAIAAYQRAVHLDPLYTDALYNLSIALNFAGRETESAAARRRFASIEGYLREATDLQLRLQRTPDDRALWTRLLALAEKHGDEERARYCRARLARLNPG